MAFHVLVRFLVSAPVRFLFVFVWLDLARARPTSHLARPDPSCIPLSSQHQYPAAFQTRTLLRAFLRLLLLRIGLSRTLSVPAAVTLGACIK